MVAMTEPGGWVESRAAVNHSKALLDSFTANARGSVWALGEAVATLIRLGQAEPTGMEHRLLTRELDDLELANPAVKHLIELGALAMRHQLPPEG